MRKTKIASSNNNLPKKRRNPQEYFDLNQAQVSTPKQRSLPKYKHSFNPIKKQKSSKQNPIALKRLSQGKL